MEQMKKNAGFSTLELVVTIAIVAVMTSVLTAFTVGQIEKSKRVTALTNAQAIFATAQYAIIDANEMPDFKYAVKFEETIDGNTMKMGRFSNQSLYKYLQESGGSESLSSAKSKKVDYYIASQLANSIPGAADEITESTLKNKSPIGDSHSVKYMSEHPETYGKVVFAMAYDSSGQIIYFQCVYDGYFIYNNGRTLEAEKVRDDLYFNDWPTQRFAQSQDEKW